MTEEELSDLQDLQVAFNLIEQGIPVVVCQPALDDQGNWDPSGGSGNTGYIFPKWREITEAKKSLLDSYRPGCALIMLTGFGLDLVDVDPRNDGDLSGLVEAGIMPTTYMGAASPSGGTHAFVSSLGVHSRDNFQRGIDLKAGVTGEDGSRSGGGIAFIAPTRRKSKVDNVIRKYSWTKTDLDMWADDRGVDDSGSEFATMVEDIRNANQRPVTRVSKSADAVPFSEQDFAGQDRITRYMDATLKGIANDLAEAGSWREGYRDDQGRGWEKLTSDMAFRLGELWQADWNDLTEQQCLDLLIRNAPRGQDWGRADIEKKWHDQKNRPEVPAAMPDGDPDEDLSFIMGPDWDGSVSNASVREIFERPPVVEVLRPVPDLPPPPVSWPPEGLDTFFDAKPFLSKMRQTAQSRGVAPWAAFGVSAARSMATVPPHVVLPGVIGGVGSLNLFVALVAGSGLGKGAAMSLGREIINLPHTIPVLNIGSGEGLTRAYARREGKGADSEIVIHTPSVLYQVQEIDGLRAVGDRSGATIMSVLRTACSGEQLGFNYADETKNIHLQDHQYRMTMIMGVQPKKAGWILTGPEADGGTPQRFLWLPAQDPNMQDEWPEMPEMPEIPLFESWSNPGGFIEVSIPDSVRGTIRRAHIARNLNQTDALDGHALIVREKVAYALALMGEGSSFRITEEDWELAGMVMTKSKETRDSILADLISAEDEEDERAGRRQGTRNAASDDRKHANKIRAASKSMLNRIENHGPATYAQLRQSVRYTDREQYAQAAYESLMQKGRITADEDGHHAIGL